MPVKSFGWRLLFSCIVVKIRTQENSGGGVNMLGLLYLVSVTFRS